MSKNSLPNQSQIESIEMDSNANVYAQKLAEGNYYILESVVDDFIQNGEVFHIQPTPNVVSLGLKHAKQFSIEKKGPSGALIEQYLLMDRKGYFSTTPGSIYPTYGPPKVSKAKLEQIDNKGRLYKLPPETVSMLGVVSDEILANQDGTLSHLTKLEEILHDHFLLTGDLPKKLKLKNIVISRKTGEYKLTPDVEFLKPDDAKATEAELLQTLDKEIQERSKRMKKFSREEYQSFGKAALYLHNQKEGQDR